MSSAVREQSACCVTLTYDVLTGRRPGTVRSPVWTWSLDRPLQSQRSAKLGVEAGSRRELDPLSTRCKQALVECAVRQSVHVLYGARYANVILIRAVTMATAAAAAAAELIAGS